jgi:hypothetical protein
MTIQTMVGCLKLSTANQESANLQIKKISDSEPTAIVKFCVFTDSIFVCDLRITFFGGLKTSAIFSQKNWLQ